MLRKIFGNTTAQIVSRFITSGASFVVTILVARFLGIAGYSDIAKIIAFASLFYLCVDLGANAIFLQLEKQEQKFSDLLFFRLFLAVAAYILVIFIIIFLPYDAHQTSGYSLLVKEGIVLFAFSFFSRAIVFSAGALFQQNLSYQKAMLASLLGSLSTLGVVGWALYSHASLLWIIVAYVVGGFVEAGYSLFLIRTEVLFGKPNKTFVRKMILSSLPLALLLFINLIYFRADVVMLSFLKKATDVGAYDFAYKFFDFFIALPLFLSNSLYPSLIAQEKNNRIQTKNIYLYTSLFFLAGTILAPIIWIAAPLIIFVKKEFILSIFPLRLLVMSLPIFFATNILQWILITKKKQNFLVGIYAVALVLNIGLNLLFIPQFSYNASAVVTGVSEACLFIAMLAYIFLHPL